MFSGCGQHAQQEEIYISEESVTEESSEATETFATEFAEESIEATENTEAESDSEVATEMSEEVSEEVSEEASEIVQVPTEPVRSKFDDISEQVGISVDRVEIDLPNVQNTYELLFLSDMHVLKVDETVAADKVEEARLRQDVMFRTRKGVASAEAWPKIASVLDSFAADGIILGGDMMDFTSNTNGEVLMEGLALIRTPYMYLRADHDLGVWYSGGALTTADALVFHNIISDYQDMFVMEYPEFYVLGWNNSTSQLSEDGFAAALSIWNNGKPIILATHVPINSVIDNSLADTAASVDPQGRKKIWGDGCLYLPDGTTGAFLSMIYDENSPVKAVLSGHLHFKHTIQITNNTIEYVFGPGFEGNIAKIVVK